MPVAGVDEAGRGALAGPVVAAAVILPYAEHYPFDDSKALSAAMREAFSQEIRKIALAVGIGLASPAEIDRLNVLQATHLAAARALQQLSERLEPQALVTDFLKLAVAVPVSAPPKADGLSFQVAAASILAKTHRDALMRHYDVQHPGYGFATHKGYGAPTHLRALAEKGPCIIHRLSFKPVAQRRLFESS